MVKIAEYPPLVTGWLQRRYKRFLADVELEDGSVVTAFCPNPGSMMGLLEPGTPALLSESSDPGRRTAHTLELLRPVEGTWVAVNTLRTNAWAARVIERGLAGEALRGYAVKRREVAYGDSRLDFLLEAGRGEAYLEVKSVTLRVGAEARFPDAVTLRGRRHLRALMRAREEGKRAFMLYLVQREDCRCFAPAEDIDREYARAFREAVGAGVGVVVLALSVGAGGVYLLGGLPLCGGDRF
jgi:sugar fermentation stimulation protein A